MRSYPSTRDRNRARSAGPSAAITSSSFCPVKYVWKNSVRVIPSRRCSSSVTPVSVLATGTSPPSRKHSAVVSPRTTR
jgi:hypothetical protein